MFTELDAQGQCVLTLDHGCNCMNSERAGGGEGSPVDVENSADKQESQETTVPMEETETSDGTSITSMEDALEPNRHHDLPSEPEDVGNHTPDPDQSSGKNSKGNSSVFQSARRVLASTNKVGISPFL